MSDKFWHIISAIVFTVLLLSCVIVRYQNKKKGLTQPTAFHKLAKYEKTIVKICDIFVICVLLLAVGWSFTFCLRTFLQRPSAPYIQESSFRYDICACLMLLTVFSGMSAVLVGALSCFHTSLTRRKRLILMIVCLMPMVMTIIHLAIDPGTINPWRIIKLGLGFSWPCWFFHGPAIVLGKSFSTLMSQLGNRFWKLLRLD